jgi:DNA polymerase-2
MDPGPIQGFLLTRHWRDVGKGADASTLVEFWLATADGPRRARLAPQQPVAFFPLEQRAAAELALHAEGNGRRQEDWELRELSLCDFQHR